MEHWQFLIQKQGDRSWHPLESPNLKIVEGRYRVLARSYLPNTNVEVRVTHTSPQEVPPQRRIFKRSHRTNPEGLITVIPFTYLQPGIWELKCSADLMADVFGQSWQYALLIEVLPQVFGQQPEMEPNDEQSALGLADVIAATTNHSTDANILLDDTEEDLIISEPVSPVWFKGETAEEILQNLIELALPVTEPATTDQKDIDSPVIPTPAPLQFILEQDNYIASWGETLTIGGLVTRKATEHSQAETSFSPNLYNLELKIELRLPSAAQISTQTQLLLANQVLPFKFNAAIEIPSECESQLILADISLYGAFAETAEVQLLGNQAFTITADVAQLLALQNQQSTPPKLLADNKPLPTQPQSVKSEATAKLGLELFNLAKAPKLAHFQVLKPSPHRPLPPRIKPTSGLAKFSPQLPKLPQSPNNEETILIVIPTPPINLAKLAIKKQKTPKRTNSFPFIKRLTPLPAQEKAVIKTPELFQLPSPEIPQPASTSNLDSITVHLPIENDAVGEILEVESTQINLDSITVHLPTENDASGEILAAESTQTNFESTVHLSTENDAGGEILEVESTQAIENTEVSISTVLNTPLLQKWIQRQGYSVLEPVDMENQGEEAEEDNQNQHEKIATFDIKKLLQLNEGIEPAKDILADEEIPESREAEAAGEAGEKETSLLELDGATEKKIAVNLSQDSPFETSKQRSSSPVHSLPAWLSQEIVIDDTNIESVVEESSHPTEEPEVQPLLEVAAHQPLEFLPTPRLFVPDGELLADTLITVRLELPQELSGVAIKLWMEDYQTRGLLDEPQVLTDLQLNSWGGLEATAQLLVPLGCLELRLQAIAFDTITQQESHKVTVIKTVVPADLSVTELDEVLNI
jgi:hypothetical protein